MVDGLRGLAILLVLYRHIFPNLTPPGAHTLWVGDVELHPWSVLSNGWVGVNLFFVDSGFVLFLPFASGARPVSTWPDVRRMYARRAWRLLPLYYVVLLGSWALLAARGGAGALSLRELSSCLTLTFPLHPSTWIPAHNPVLWSLGVEVWFSALLPVFVWLIARVGFWRWLLAACAASVLTRIAAYTWLGDARSPYLNPLADSVLGRLGNFALGMAIAVVHQRGSTARMGRPAAVACLLSAAAALGYGTALWDDHYASPSGLRAPILEDACVNVGCALLLLGALGARGLPRAVLAWAPLRAAGLACYSLYLVHGALLSSFDAKLRWSVPWGLGFLALVCAVSSLTYAFIEQPTMRRRA